jgi:hypothetical protein
VVVPVSSIRLTTKPLLDKLLIKATLSTNSQPIYGAEIKFYTGSNPLSLEYIGSSYTNENGEASITTDGYDGMYIKAVFIMLLALMTFGILIILLMLSR